MYIIQVVANTKADKSYAGNAWDKANLRSRYKDTYDDLQEACYLSYMLNFYSDKKLTVYKKRG